LYSLSHWCSFIRLSFIEITMQIDAFYLNLMPDIH